MLSRSFLRRSLSLRPLPCFRVPPRPSHFRCLTSQPATPEPQKQSWLTHRVQTSPTSKKLFMAAMRLFGYGSPKQLAGRRAFVLYEHVCAVKPDEDRQFWSDGEFRLQSRIFLRVSTLICTNVILIPLARMFTPSNISILVYHNELTYLDAYLPSARPST